MYFVNKSQENISVPIIRYKGSIGEVSVNLQYTDMTARYGLNYTGKEIIIFGHGQTNVLEIQFFEIDGNEGDILFGIKLYNPEGGAKVEKIIETKIGE